MSQISQEIASELHSIRNSVDNIDKYAQFAKEFGAISPELATFLKAFDALTGVVDTVDDSFKSLTASVTTAPATVVSAVTADANPQ